MGKSTTDPLRTGREIEKADGLGTLGGEFGLCWNDAVPLTTGAHNAFLSAFFAAGGVFDRLVDTCPLKLTSNNAPTNRETLGTAVVGMTNGPLPDAACEVGIHRGCWRREESLSARQAV